MSRAADPLPRLLAQGRGRETAWIVALALAQASAAGAAALSTRQLFAALDGATDPSAMTGALVLLAASGGAIALCRVRERLRAEGVGQDYAAALRRRLFDHMARLPVETLERQRSGATGLRFVGDLSAVRNWIGHGLGRLLAAAVVLPATGVVLWVLNPLFAAVVMPLVAVGLGATALLDTRLGPAHRRLRAERSRLAADMGERVVHAPELRLMGRFGVERARLRRRTEHLRNAALSRARLAALMRAVPDIVAGMAAAAVLGAALHSGIAAAETAGALAAVALMIAPLRDLAGVWDRRRAWLAARAKCARFLARPVLPRPAAAAKARPGREALPALRFDRVTHGVLAGVSARVRPGQTVAVTGANGAGKSTLLRLAAGLAMPERGRVRIDAVPAARRAQCGDARIAYLGSRSPILAGSLRRALTAACRRPLPADETVEAVAMEMGLGPLLQRLGGLDGRVAEGGRGLSAGERQRLLLARVRLTDAPLVILDDPEAGLDEAGRAVAATMTASLQATVLVATSDASIAATADQTWRLEDGRLIVAEIPTLTVEGTAAA